MVLQRRGSWKRALAASGIACDPSAKVFYYDAILEQLLWNWQPVGRQCTHPHGLGPGTDIWLFSRDIRYLVISLEGLCSIAGGLSGIQTVVYSLANRQHSWYFRNLVSLLFQQKTGQLVT